MKFKLLSLLFLATSLTIVSCGGDESCDNLSDTVVGSWSVDQLTDGTVTMNSDGSLVDDDRVVFTDPSLDDAVKTWDINVDTLNLNANTGAVTTFVQFTVSSFTCDQLTTAHDGNTFTFKRN